MYLLGHQSPRRHIFKSLDPKGKRKLHEKGKYNTVGKITIFALAEAEGPALAAVEMPGLAEARY